MSDRCCGVFPLNTGLRVLVIVHILLCILLMADPWSTPFMRAVVLCEDYPSDDSQRTWIYFPQWFQSRLSLSDLVFGVAGCICCALVLYQVESKANLSLLTAYFVSFAGARAYWAFSVGYSGEARQSILTFWEDKDLDSSQIGILDSCVSRLRRSALVDAVTTVLIYLYFASVVFKKLRSSEGSGRPGRGTGRDERLIEGVPIGTDELQRMDLNVLGMNGRFFVGKPLQQQPERVLGRLTSN